MIDWKYTMPSFLSFTHIKWTLYFELDDLTLFYWFTMQGVRKYDKYRIDSIYVCELLNRTSSRIVRVVAASGLAQEFRIVLPSKVKIKNSSSSVYSRIYGINCCTLCLKLRDNNKYLKNVKMICWDSLITFKRRCTPCSTLFQKTGWPIWT